MKFMLFFNIGISQGPTDRMQEPGNYGMYHQYNVKQQ